MIKVKCDVHNWMWAYVGVLDHPYFTVTTDKGSYTIDGLPAGDYRIPSPYGKPSFFRSKDKTNVFAAGARDVRVTFKVPPEEPRNYFSGQAVDPDGKHIDRADATLECSPGEPTFYILNEPDGCFSCTLTRVRMSTRYKPAIFLQLSGSKPSRPATQFPILTSRSSLRR